LLDRLVGSVAGAVLGIGFTDQFYRSDLRISLSGSVFLDFDLGREGDLDALGFEAGE
jgi:hypothetical protein